MIIGTEDVQVMGESWDGKSRWKRKGGGSDRQLKEAGHSSATVADVADVAVNFFFLLHLHFYPMQQDEGCYFHLLSLYRIGCVSWSTKLASLIRTWHNST